MAICTLKAHVSRALDFYNKEDIYFAIGKSTPWGVSDIDNFDASRDYENNPPVPKNTDDMKEIVGFKKAEFKAMVVQDDNGSLEYRGVNWRIVSPTDAVTEGARWVYISTELSYDELPTDKPYRQVGIYTGLKKSSSVQGNVYNLLPNQVTDKGLLEVIDFRKPVYRDSDVREKLKIILEF